MRAIFHRRTQRKFFAQFLFVTAFAVGGLSSPAGALEGEWVGPPKFPMTTCLWYGPYQPDYNPPANTAYPDSGAFYYAATLVKGIPEGGKLVLEGRFPHSRYFAHTAYALSTGIPTDGLNDQTILPLPGHTSPFADGAARVGDLGGYEIDVLPDPPPPDEADRLPNTLYAEDPSGPGQALIHRIYVPNRDSGPTADVPLPTPKLIMPDGSVLRGEEACKELGSLAELQAGLPMPTQDYLRLRDQPGKPPTFPAEDPMFMPKSYSESFDLSCKYGLPYPTNAPQEWAQCLNSPPSLPAQFSNLDNAYGQAVVSTAFRTGKNGQRKPVLVLSGRMGTTPKTFDNIPVFDASTELRYWSMCVNEGPSTTRVTQCLIDEEVPRTKDGDYTIVVSRPEDRPSNAVESCGFAWLAWSPLGDAASTAPDATPDVQDDLDFGEVINRNMLPAPTFHRAFQDAPSIGTERSVMGDYLPTGEYMSVAQFEALGCPAEQPVTLCHAGKKTLSLPGNAAAAHLRHGDAIGACAR